MKNKETKEKLCKECMWLQKTVFDPAHYWWCPLQDDRELLRGLVKKFKEICDRLDRI